MDARVLPLLVGFYVQQFHERVKLYFVELVAEVLSMHEVLVLERHVRDLLHRWVLRLFREV